jgi:HEPN superfamily AbiU2-like protein
MTSPTPSLEQVMKGLIAEVLKGRQALAIAVGLRGADQVVLDVAPVFFGMAYDGNIELAQMYAAKLYDKTKNPQPITVATLLSIAEQHPELFKKGTESEVLKAAKECRNLVANLEVPLASIKRRRDEALAHLDAKSVMNPGGLKRTAPLTITEIEKIFHDTETILKKMDYLFRATIGDLKYLGHDDYQTVIDLIADAKCAQADQYEKEFGIPCEWPLPAKCARVKNKNPTAL